MTLSPRPAPAFRGVASWLDVLAVADVHASSSDASGAIDDAFRLSGDGWRAGRTGPQIIRVRFRAPQDLHRIQLAFDAPPRSRTQEIVITATSRRGAQVREIVRRVSLLQDGNAGLHVDDHVVSAFRVEAIEIRIQPDVRGHCTVAALRACRLA